MAVLLPDLVPVRQPLFSDPVPDIPAAAATALAATGIRDRIRRGDRVAITAGSRGIAQIAAILRAVVATLAEWGARPFLVPAMGSHGGATAEGQRQLLAETFGITESAMGCPILSSMDVAELGRTPEHDLPVYLDRHAASADAIVVVNRVKPHTDFTGPVESGLMKMITIGLGKRAQAESVHAYGAWGLRELVPEVARAKIARSRIVGGLAILEDGRDQTHRIVGVPAEGIATEEPRLLCRAREIMAKLPWPSLDLLIVDRIGKEISGAGMDPNVIGRKRIEGEPEFASPRIERIVVRDLTDESHGNGIGTGLADIITRRLYDRIDWEVTNTNSLVSGFTQRSMVPFVADSDRHALETARYLLRRKPVEQLRVARIRDTLHLEQLWASENLLAEVPGLTVLGPPAPVQFDDAGRLVEPAVPAVA